MTAADRIAVQDLLAAYLDAIDRFDWPAVGACFAPDARASYGGAEAISGRERIVDMLRSHHLADASTHLLGGVVVAPEREGVRARSTVVAHIVRGGVLRIRGLRYEDRLERRRGAWLITDRVHSLQWMAEAPAVG